MQGAAPLTYDVDVYRARADIDDWFSVYGLLLLTKAEYFVLRFIVARTIHYGKLREIIFKSHFLEGVQAGGEWKAAPCGVNSRDLYTALASLENKKIIGTYRIVSDGRHVATAYEISVPTLLSLRESPKLALKIPKKLANMAVPNGTTVPEGPRCQMAPKNSIQIKSKTNSNDVGCGDAPRNARIRRIRPAFTENEIDCKAKVQAVIAQAAKVTAIKQLEKVRRGRAAAPAAITLTDLNATWKRCMVRHFGSCSIVGLTHREFGIFKKVVKNHEIAFTWEEFFDWAIPAWATLSGSRSESNAYRKSARKEWSLKDRDTVSLGTSTPMLSAVVYNFARLAKIFLDKPQAGKAADSAEVEQLRAELAAAHKEAKAAKEYARSVSSVKREAFSTTKAHSDYRNVATIANPESDDFFDTQAALPSWPKK
jgi:hypothetical protein